MKITAALKKALISSMHLLECTNVNQGSHGSRFPSRYLNNRFHEYEAGLTKTGHEVSENSIFK